MQENRYDNPKVSRVLPEKSVPIFLLINPFLKVSVFKVSVTVHEAMKWL